MLDLKCTRERMALALVTVTIVLGLAARLFSAPFIPWTRVIRRMDLACSNSAAAISFSMLVDAFRGARAKGQTH